MMTNRTIVTIQCLLVWIYVRLCQFSQTVLPRKYALSVA